MAFEFKKLSDVNVIETMKDGLNVLVEDGGEIVKLAANSMIPEDVALKSDIPTGVVKSVNGEVPDETGNVLVSGLPEGMSPHMQLVTDAEGNTKWEERTHYVKEGFMHNPEIENKTFKCVDFWTDESGVMWGVNSLKGLFQGMYDGAPYLVIFDNKEYPCTLSFVREEYDGGVNEYYNIIPNDVNAEFQLMAWADGNSSNISVKVETEDRETEHTISCIALIENVQQIPEKYIPGNKIVCTFDYTNDIVTCNIKYRSVFIKAIEEGSPIIIKVINAEGAIELITHNVEVVPDDDADKQYVIRAYLKNEIPDVAKECLGLYWGKNYGFGWDTDL